MTGKQLHDLFKSHGGVARVHTRPVEGGWANTIVCKDGFKRTLTVQEEKKLSAYQDKQEASSAR